MKIEPRIVEDLKTERTDVTPALAPYFRLVPILFYLVVGGGIVLSASFLVVLRNAATEQQHWLGEAAKGKQALADLQVDRDSIERQAHRANDVAAWVEGARNLQPLVVTTVRSLDSGSSIADFGLVRDPANATQIKLVLKLNTQSQKQLDTTLEQITALNFRSYNPNQTQSRGEVDYEATLIYQGGGSHSIAAPPITKAPTTAATYSHP